MGSTEARVIKEAAAVPLDDGAFMLWTYRLHYGPTFELLQAAHPEASEAKLRAAIQTAADFESACLRNFEYVSAHLGEDADRAIQAARAEYPQFLEKTYQLASFRLAVAMR